MSRRFLYDHLPRVLVASFFILNAILFMATFKNQVVAMGMTVVGVSLAFAVVAVAIVIKLVCGTMILANWKTRSAALILAVFMVIATLIENPNWGDIGLYNLTQFFKNLAIIGGLLLLAQHSDNSRSEMGNADDR